MIGFFSDPRGLPMEALDFLDKRASIVSMVIALVGLPVTLVVLFQQQRPELPPSSAATSSAPPTPPSAGPSGEQSAGDQIQIFNNTVHRDLMGKQESITYNISDEHDR
ncbi:hypothetical protein ABZW49_31275 [Nonomuraea wenchangensis]